MKNNSFASALFVFVGALTLAVLFSLFLSFPLMLLWNGCLVPATTILNEVSWMQMWGISFLTSSLFKTYSIGSK